MAHLHSDGYPDDWTERPHWVVMRREPFCEPRCVGHGPTKALAATQAAQARVNDPAARVWLQRTR